MTTQDKPTHGGKRDGAGRPKVHDELVRVTVTITPEQVSFLTILGNGNLSAGIRKSVEILEVTRY